VIEHLDRDGRRRFLERRLTVEELLATDEHVAKCPQCQAALQAEMPPRAEQWAHLTYEELAACLGGEAPAEASQHLESCGRCSGDLADLRMEQAALPASKVAWWRALLKPLPAAGVAVAVLTLIAIFVLRQPEARTQQAVVLHLPAELLDLKPKGGELLSGEAGSAWNIVGPAATLVETDRPVFTWQPLASAKSYVVEVYDSDYNRVDQGATSGVAWRPDAPLPRGVVLQWRVRAGDRSAPAPPKPEARFRVLRQEDEARWATLEQQYRADPVRLGVEAANLGLREKAVDLLGKRPEGAALRDQLIWP